MSEPTIAVCDALESDLNDWVESEFSSEMPCVPDFWDECGTSERVAAYLATNGLVAALLSRIDHLTAAITTHHAIKHGSDPATARAVLAPVDRALYAAAGVPHAVLGAFAGRGGTG